MTQFSFLSELLYIMTRSSKCGSTIDWAVWHGRYWSQKVTDINYLVSSMRVKVTPDLFSGLTSVLLITRVADIA